MDKIPSRRESVENIISSLADLRDCLCCIYRYLRSHQQLLIAVHKPDSLTPSFYLHFEMAGYFEGPLNWRGADFRLGTDEECKEVICKIGTQTNKHLDLMSKHLYFLFLLERPDYQVKILAATCNKITQDDLDRARECGWEV